MISRTDGTRASALRERIERLFLPAVCSRRTQDAGIAARALVATDPEVETILEAAVREVVETILEAAVREDLDLLAMTTHGRTGLDRLVLGWVAEAVLRRCPWPLLVKRTGAPGQPA